MRRIVLLFAMLMLIAAAPAGCARPTATPPPTLGAQKDLFAGPLKEPVDMGQLCILTSGMFADDSRQSFARRDALTELISKAIAKQRNIKLSVLFIDTGDVQRLPGELARRTAAGNPPGAVVRMGGDEEFWATAQTPAPLRLNEAIEQYGPNLSKLPDSCWDSSRIGDAVVSLPTDYEPFHLTMLTVNGDLLGRYGWKAPQSFEELEQLMARAKAKGLQVIDNPYGLQSWFGVPDDSFCLRPDDGGALQPFATSPDYVAYLSTMRDWAEKGYVAPDDGSGGDWLLKGYSGAEEENIVALPPLPATAAEPVVLREVSYINSTQLEAYDRPEALVTLMDWAVATRENHCLMALGEENVDYTIQDNVYRREGEPGSVLWDGQIFFAINGLFPDLIDGQTVNPTAFRAEREYAEAHARPADYPALPPATRRYAQKGTALFQAWQGLLSYNNKMGEAAWRYMNGEISLDDYNHAAEESAPLVAGYLQLVEAYRKGAYDPTADMVVPQ